MTNKDIFLELRDILNKDLLRSGFIRRIDPPGPEPILPKRIRELSTADVSDLCDDFQAFYNYLTDEIIYCTTFEGTAKARLDTVWAEARKRALLDTTLTNDKARDLEASLDDAYLHAVVDVTYFKSTHEKYEEWRRKISRSQDRINRELLTRGGMPRTAPTSQFGRVPLPSQQGMPHAFKPVQRDSVQSSAADAAAVDEQDVHQDEE